MLIVGAGPFQLGLFGAARSLDLEIVAVDRDPEAPGMPLADFACPVDVCNLPAVLEVAHAHDVGAVVSAASDAALPAVAHVAEHRGLPGPHLDEVWRCNDKLLTHTALDQESIAVPATLLVRTPAEGANLGRELRWERIVVKPRCGAGGRGVSVCLAGQDLGKAIEKAARYVDRHEGVLLQEYVEGTAIGVEACLFRGELLETFILDDQFTPGFASPIGHSLPSRLPATLQARVRQEVRDVVKALGLRHGLVNLDLRLRDGQVVVLEVNPRLGGNSISELIQRSWGIDLYAVAVLISLGLDPFDALRRRHLGAAAARLLVSSQRGRVWVDGTLPEALELLVDDGAATGLHVDEWAIVGRAICKADEPEDAADMARRHCEDAARAIRIEPIE